MKDEGQYEQRDERRGRGGKIDEEKRGNVPQVVLVLLVALRRTKHSSAWSERLPLSQFDVVVGRSHKVLDDETPSLLSVVTVVSGRRASVLVRPRSLGTPLKKPSSSSTSTPLQKGKTSLEAEASRGKPGEC
jgi:hypothetical protein